LIALTWIAVLFIPLIAYLLAKAMEVDERSYGLATAVAMVQGSFLMLGARLAWIIDPVWVC
jgi:hypothetical protein